MAIHRLLRKIERAGMDPKTLKGGKPIAWAAPGLSAGIGTEIGLACHRRFIADTPKARIGLPEILIGIFPGAGGTTRLVRMMGADGRRAPSSSKARCSAPAAAKAAGLVDEVVAARRPPRRARRPGSRPRPTPTSSSPGTRKGYKLPGGAPYHPAGFMTFVGASAMVHGRTQGAYPPPQAMLSAIYEGALVALRHRAPHRGALVHPRPDEPLLLGDDPHGLPLQAGAGKGRRPPRPARPERAEARRPRRRDDGRRHRHRRRQAGIEVVLIDRDQAAADKGRAHAEAWLDDGMKRSATTPEKKRDAVLARITATPDYAALAGCDIVIEAVFEDPAVKAEATRRAEAALPADAIFATNTSTLPIGDLAKASRDPAAFIGIHFFSPVEKMALVEIIRGRRPATAPSPRRSTSSARSARPRSSSTTPASSTPTAASSPTSTRASAWSPKASRRR